eukprot:COSAG02_NODE_5399_length_4362_cov_4.231527_3_plen_184_part_00
MRRCHPPPFYAAQTPPTSAPRVQCSGTRLCAHHATAPSSPSSARLPCAPAPLHHPPLAPVQLLTKATPVHPAPVDGPPSCAASTKTDKKLATSRILRHRPRQPPSRLTRLTLQLTCTLPRTGGGGRSRGGGSLFFTPASAPDLTTTNSLMCGWVGGNPGTIPSEFYRQPRCTPQIPNCRSARK